MNLRKLFYGNAGTQKREGKSTEKSRSSELCTVYIISEQEAAARGLLVESPFPDFDPECSLDRLEKTKMEELK